MMWGMANTACSHTSTYTHTHTLTHTHTPHTHYTHTQRTHWRDGHSKECADLVRRRLENLKASVAASNAQQVVAHNAQVHGPQGECHTHGAQQNMGLDVQGKMGPLTQKEVERQGSQDQTQLPATQGHVQGGQLSAGCRVKGVECVAQKQVPEPQAHAQGGQRPAGCSAKGVECIAQNQVPEDECLAQGRVPEGQGTAARFCQQDEEEERQTTGAVGGLEGKRGCSSALDPSALISRESSPTQTQTQHVAHDLYELD